MNNLDGSTTPTQMQKVAEVDHSSALRIAARFAKALQQYPDSTQSIIDSISDSQLLSKEWIAETVNGIDLGDVMICGGWFAMLLFSDVKYEKCLSIDIDPICENIAKIIHKRLVIDGWKFQAITDDIHNINYSGHRYNVKRSDGTLCELFMKPDTIINTSCEHIENFNEWWDKIPEGTFVILQTNDGFDIEGHINCVEDLAEFTEQTPLTTEIYSGSKAMPKFIRFMRIGYK